MTVLTAIACIHDRTREILEGMGYKAGDIDKLTASGVVECYRG